MFWKHIHVIDQGVEDVKVHISFRGSLMFQQGVVEGGGGAKKSLKHTVSASQ